ncbi:MAG: DUF4234 domain-containing protein [Thermoleophilia bacterium]|nr:DUF4234 domain-containing protein [Thermoleophilia bacterium]
MNGSENSAALESILRQRPSTDWQVGFWNAFLLVLITCGIYGVYVLYKIMDRRLQHFERMISFRYYLIQLLKERAAADGRMDELGQDISRLEGMHVETSNRDRAGEKSPVLWLVLGLVTGVTNFYVFYFLNDDFRTHEANEHMFMLTASEIMQKLGMSHQQIVTARMVPERNFIMYLVFTFITCGVYGIYWWYTLITDPNSHFDVHTSWENYVYGIISSQVQTGAQPGQ